MPPQSPRSDRLGNLSTSDWPHVSTGSKAVGGRIEPSIIDASAAQVRQLAVVRPWASTSTISLSADASKPQNLAMWCVVRAPGDRDQLFRLIATTHSRRSRPPVDGG